MERTDPKKHKRESIERLTAAYLAKGGAIKKVREGKRVIPEFAHKLAFIDGESVAERNSRYTTKRRSRR
jgi:hypothetical protein